MTGTRVAALRLLGRRDYTTHELRERLLAREHPADDVDAALDSLRTDGLLDDRRVAASHVRIATSVKGRGRLRIARELEARGLDRALVQEALAALPADEDAEAIRRWLARRALPPRLPAADHRRVFAQLLRRGFPADAIARVLRERAG